MAKKSFNAAKKELAKNKGVSTKRAGAMMQSMRTPRPKKGY